MSIILNSHGLSRTISDPIARLIRQKSGFGCIFCGLWIYQYEHILPEFKDATRHNPEYICLLCANHHQKVTQNRISKNQVVEQYKHPIAFQKGYANDFLELDTRLGIVIGRIFIPEPVEDILVINENPIISYKQPSADEPMKISAKFYDSNGVMVMEIIENEQRGNIKNWDIEQSGNTTIIRRKHRDVVLQFSISSKNIFKIEKINLNYQDTTITGDSLSGRFIIKAGKNGSTIDFNSAQVITGAIKISGNRIEIKPNPVIGGTQFIGGGVEMKEMDYQSFMDNGRINSVK